MTLGDSGGEGGEARSFRAESITRVGQRAIPLSSLSGRPRTLVNSPMANLLASLWSYHIYRISNRKSRNSHQRRYLPIQSPHGDR